MEASDSGQFPDPPDSSQSSVIRTRFCCTKRVASTLSLFGYLGQQPSAQVGARICPLVVPTASTTATSSSSARGHEGTQVGFLRPISGCKTRLGWRGRCRPEGYPNVQTQSNQEIEEDQITHLRFRSWCLDRRKELADLHQ